MSIHIFMYSIYQETYIRSCGWTTSCQDSFFERIRFFTFIQFDYIFYSFINRLHLQVPFVHTRSHSITIFCIKVFLPISKLISKIEFSFFDVQPYRNCNMYLYISYIYINWNYKLFTNTYTWCKYFRTRGRNIRFSNQQCVAMRTDTEFCHGYAFTSRALLLGERLVVQILATESMYVGALALGLTSCDPARLTAEDLPDDSDALLDRPEYWVVSKDVASSPQPGDEIAFTVTHFGEVNFSPSHICFFSLHFGNFISWTSWNLRS